MLFKSALVTQISGSVGGMTGSRNRGGMYFRARAIPTDPNTASQANLRALFGALVQRWTNELSAAQRGSWNDYAAFVPLTGPLGDPITVSGQNHYIRSNTPRSLSGRTLADLAPFLPDLGTLDAVSVTSISEATQLATVVFDDTDGWNIADGFMQMQWSRPTSPAINFFRGPYRQFGVVNGDAPGVSPQAQPVPFVVVATQRIFARFRASYPDGRLTQAQFVGPIDVVA